MNAVPNPLALAAACREPEERLTHVSTRESSELDCVTRGREGKGGRQQMKKRPDGGKENLCSLKRQSFAPVSL